MEPYEYWSGKKWILIDMLLLLPSLLFWISVVLYVSLGSDFVFNMILEPYGTTWWGNILVILLVIGFPSVVVGLSGMLYIMHKKRIFVITGVSAILLIFLGFAALLQK